MYQTSLKQFLHLFDGSISKAMRTPNISERVGSILETLNREVWQATLRGIYEQHQFLFTLLMAIKVSPLDSFFFRAFYVRNFFIRKAFSCCSTRGMNRSTSTPVC